MSRWRFTDVDGDVSTMTEADLAAFVDLNGFDADFAELLRDMPVGVAADFGGGAQPPWKLERLS